MVRHLKIYCSNVKTETIIEDKVSMIKLKPGDFNPNDGCSFKVGNPRSNVEGGEGLASANADSIAAKFYPKVDPSIKPEGMSDKVNLDSKADRIKFANSSTQMATKSGDAFTNGCGPACIVNGAMMDGGKEGLLNFVKVIKERGRDSYEQEGVATKRWKEISGWDKLDDIKTRIKDNTATRQDMISLQEIVYHQLRHMESPKRNGGDGTTSINVDKLREYINTDTSTLGIAKDRSLQKTFKDMNVKLIDTDGGKKIQSILFYFLIKILTENLKKTHYMILGLKLTAIRLSMTLMK